MTVCVSVDKGATHMTHWDMARPPTRSVHNVSVKIEGPIGEENWLNLGGELWLRGRFTAEIDDPGLKYLVTLSVGAQSGRLVAEGISVQSRQAGTPVTKSSLRTITVDAYLGIVRRELSENEGGFLIVREEQVTREISNWGSVDSTDWKEFDKVQRRRRTTAETLPLVAKLYREALASLDAGIAASPTKYVAEHLPCHRGYASRLVNQARAVGLLGSARRGMAGETTTKEMKEE